MERHSPLEHIPEHLTPFIARQDATLYTPIDHASWRFILKISKAFFSAHAQEQYLNGLKATGISSERIPLVEEMDQCLRRFGWRAVPVSGFIPPAVFMEFQSLGVLPIACEMRTLDHLAYTPAPDIVHEAAGHAPIVADPEYAAYLRKYGEVSRKAIFSNKDMAVYEAIRELSDIKEDPASSEEEILNAQRKLDETSAKVNYVSEATQLARMNWWTVEYGLIGNLEAPKIYGAGLLSSVGESYACLNSDVGKIPFTLDCINTSYDITRPQPQLYVTPDFATLGRVLEEFAVTMAFQKGGVEGLAKAKMASTLITAQLDSGVQISGSVENFLVDSKGNPCFLKFSGPTQLSHGDAELPGQGPSYHKQGYSTPVGPLASSGKSTAQLSNSDLEAFGFTVGVLGTLRFDSEIELRGRLLKKQELDGHNLVLTFEHCTVKRGDQILYMPEWGPFDLACGLSVASVFGGAADRGPYVTATGGYEQKPRKLKSNLTEVNRSLNLLYAMIRELREGASTMDVVATKLTYAHEELEKHYPHDWLLRLEILEIIQKTKWIAPWESQLTESLKRISDRFANLAPLIVRGLARIDEIGSRH